MLYVKMKYRTCNVRDTQPEDTLEERPGERAVGTDQRAPRQNEKHHTMHHIFSFPFEGKTQRDHAHSPPLPPLLAPSPTSEYKVKLFNVTVLASRQSATVSNCRDRVRGDN